MADIFLSYKRADASHAAKIVALLEHEGWSVWWDDRIAAGDHWNAEIAREFGAAHCVVVIWSPNSIDPSQAHWVHEEAHNGRGRGILVPVTIEGVTPPLGFTLVQARNLSRWDGASRDGAAADFLADVRKMLGQAPAAPAV
ncbi:MAG: toll/interleukin-1 receptor domain-containing protein, partial [Rhodomicrobium sp.]